MIKAVIFDLFETLITEWGHEKYTKLKMSEELRVPYEQFDDAWESLETQQYRGGITYEDSLRHVCRVLSVPVEEDVIARMSARRRETKAACFDHMLPEIVPMLEELRRRGYRIGILSNCSGEEVDVVRESVLVPLTDHIVLSHETGLCKPERGIYQLAADGLGVQPEECVFIGDGGSRELYGAENIGMKPYRAMWYVRCMPNPVREQPEFNKLEKPVDVLNIPELM